VSDSEFKDKSHLHHPDVFIVLQQYPGVHYHILCVPHDVSTVSNFEFKDKSHLHQLDVFIVLQKISRSSLTYMGSTHYNEPQDVSIVPNSKFKDKSHLHHPDVFIVLQQYPGVNYHILEFNSKLWGEWLIQNHA